MPTDPARRLERAVVALTTQVRRIADAMPTPTDDAPTTGDDRSPEPFGYEHRDTLGILLSRMGRGVLLTDERPLLREHVEHLLADRDRLGAALDRVQAFADRLDADADRIAAGTVHPVAAHIRAALGRSAAGQVDDSSHSPAAVVHPGTEQQASSTGDVDEPTATVEALARGLAGAAHINGRSAPWDDLTPPEQDRFRVEARRAHTPPADTTEER
ncbi:hypothetical protein [Streptomyces decoyicus]|uniref:hypothetical protein n=1 Tax=Streptomyces decoyicus TaxID=249567 RepID=UPI00382E535F